MPDRRRRLAGALLIAALALTVRVGYWAEIRGTPLDAWHRWDQTDMAGYLMQARRFADGDWLGRNPVHPYVEIQKSAGTEADWLRWYGPTAFHQAPLYSYALAWTTRVLGLPVDFVKLLQIVLGAGTCVLIAGMALSIAGEGAALLAGLIAALYAPLYYLELQLLREGPAIFGFALLLWLLTRPEDPSPFRVGLLLGVYAMFYETAGILMAGAAAILLLRTGRRPWRLRVVVAAALAGGFLMGFAPLLVRNVLVGSPPLATSSRLGVNLAAANLSGAAGGGVLFTLPGPQLARVMDVSGGSVPGIVREVWRSHGDQPWRLLANLGRRAMAAFTSVELPDNTSFAFYRRQSWVLAFSLTFPWIFAPATASILLLLAVRRVWTEHTRVHAGLLAFVPLLIAALAVVFPQARYRLFLVPILVVYAALFPILVARCFRAGAHRTVAALLAAVVVLFAAQRALSAPLQPVVERPVDYAVAAHLALGTGQPESAIRYCRKGVAMYPEYLELRLELVRFLANAGHYEEAIAELQATAQRHPGLPGLSEALARLQALSVSPPPPR